MIVNNDFVQEHKGLIVKLIARGSRKWTPEEAQLLYVDTVIKLMINARYYNEKYTVGTFIGLQVHSAIAEFVKEDMKEDAMKHTVGEPIPDITFREYAEVDTEGLELLQEKVNPYMSFLSRGEQQVFTHYVYNGLTQEQVADRLGLHRSTVQKSLKRAERKLSSLITKGRRVSRMIEVDKDLRLEDAIRVLPDTQYHAYRLHHFKGLPLRKVADMMGRGIEEIQYSIDGARRYIQGELGVRA